MTRYRSFTILFCQIPHRWGRPHCPTGQFTPSPPTSCRGMPQMSGLAQSWSAVWCNSMCIIPYLATSIGRQIRQILAVLCLIRISLGLTFLIRPTRWRFNGNVSSFGDWRKSWITGALDALAVRNVTCSVFFCGEASNALGTPSSCWFSEVLGTPMLVSTIFLKQRRLIQYDWYPKSTLIVVKSLNDSVSLNS